MTSDHRDRVREQMTELQERLRQLRLSLYAAPGNQPQQAFPLHALVVGVASRRIAVPAAQVLGVEPMVLVSSLPGAPRAVRGTINYRGRLVAVLGLHEALGGGPSALAPEMFLVLIAAGEREFALAVDEMLDVREFAAASVATELEAEQLPSFVVCLLRGEQTAVVLIDPPSLLAVGELDVLDQLMAELPAGSAG